MSNGIEVVLNGFRDMETGKRYSRNRFCTVRFEDHCAIITYTWGEHKDSFRKTSRVSKIYRRPVYDLAHNHLWDEVVIRTENTEYAFSQGRCRCDRDYEVWDEYDSILRGELLDDMDDDERLRSIAREISDEMKSRPHAFWYDIAKEKHVSNRDMLKLLSWCFV